MIERNGEHFYQAELMRVRGEILAKRGDNQRAQSALGAARDYARERRCHGFELRAILALARLPSDGSAEPSLLEQLDTCLACFKGGADTTDVRAAVKLRAELAAAAQVSHNLSPC